jgi:hypothetical protein
MIGRRKPADSGGHHDLREAIAAGIFRASVVTELLIAETPELAEIRQAMLPLL